jgi:hypothetical protein
MKPERWVLLDNINEYLRYGKERLLFTEPDYDKDCYLNILDRYDMTIEQLSQLNDKVELYKTIDKARL